MLGKIKLWTYGAAAAIVVFIAAWLYRKGASDNEAKVAAHRLEEVKKMRIIEDEVNGAGDDYVIDILTRGVSDNKR